jgi:hypothetical protein
VRSLQIYVLSSLSFNQKSVDCGISSVLVCCVFWICLVHCMVLHVQTLSSYVVSMMEAVILHHWRLQSHLETQYPILVMNCLCHTLELLTSTPNLHFHNEIVSS